MATRSRALPIALLALFGTLQSLSSSAAAQGAPAVHQVCSLYLPVPQVPSEPAPVGAPSALIWDKAPARPVANLVRGDKVAPSDLSATFRVVWTTEELLVLVEVYDAGGATYINSPYPWEDDSVEIYVDADGSRSTTYDAYDFQYIARPLYRGHIQRGVNSATTGNGTRIRERHDSSGYLLEWSIPWTALGVVPSVGHYIGFDVHVNDDDDRGDRDHKIAAFALSDEAWERPRSLGMLRLASY